MSALPEYTLAEVAQHRTRESCWVVLSGSVYDFTPFIDEHPGGADDMRRFRGRDATEVSFLLIFSRRRALDPPSRPLGRS